MYRRDQPHNQKRKSMTKFLALPLDQGSGLMLSVGGQWRAARCEVVRLNSPDDSHELTNVKSEVSLLIPKYVRRPPATSLTSSPILARRKFAPTRSTRQTARRILNPTISSLTNSHRLQMVCDSSQRIANVMTNFARKAVESYDTAVDDRGQEGVYIRWLDHLPGTSTRTAESRHLHLPSPLSILIIQSR